MPTAPALAGAVDGSGQGGGSLNRSGEQVAGPVSSRTKDTASDFLPPLFDGLFSRFLLLVRRRAPPDWLFCPGIAFSRARVSGSGLPARSAGLPPRSSSGLPA